MEVYADKIKTLQKLTEADCFTYRLADAEEELKRYEADLQECRVAEALAKTEFDDACESVEQAEAELLVQQQIHEVVLSELQTAKSALAAIKKQSRLYKAELQGIKREFERLSEQLDLEPLEIWKNEPYPKFSMFVPDVLSWNPKGDRHSMEHPFYSLSKRSDIKPREYLSPDGKSRVLVLPSLHGMPTIWDKDILIYISTLIRSAMKRGDMGPENRSIRIDTSNYLGATAKGDSSQQYKEFAKAIKRLHGCTIETNIETNGTSVQEGIHLIENYRVITKTKTGKIASVELKIADWLYGAILNANEEMLSIHKKYFKLTGGIERRIYEIARKHCGRQPYWSVGIENLWIKSGSRGELKKFRHSIFHGQVDLDNLLEYFVELHPDEDKVTFYSKNHKTPMKTLLEVLRKPSRKRPPAV